MFIQKVLMALEEAKLPYALVGGYAVALHGAVRGTVDVDLVIRLESADFEKVEQIFKKLGLVPRLPVSAKEVFEFRVEYIENRNLIAWTFLNPNLPSELVDVIITEDLRDMRVVNKKAIGMNIKLASIEDVIRMKKKAARPQDLLDVEALEKLL
ncbi:MAG: hypothetical protein OEZ47_11910 [Gammaproteobacteria bacterium]|nr:hypothetical protein [Gammaproteobacteria bacterium]